MLDVLDEPEKVVIAGRTPSCDAASEALDCKKQVVSTKTSSPHDFHEDSKCDVLRTARYKFALQSLVYCLFGTCGLKDSVSVLVEWSERGLAQCSAVSATALAKRLVGVTGSVVSKRSSYRFKSA